MKNITYIPRGICSKQITFDIDGDKVRNVSFTGGCHGNHQGIGKLVEGMTVDEVISRLEGINCNGRGTSCPDQLAQALKENR